MSQKQFDIIIAGAGASGLTLLYYLLKSPVGLSSRILLIDRYLEPDPSKTWCFWDDNGFEMPEMIYHTWNHLTVSALGSTFSEELISNRYHCIRSVDYSGLILDMAEKSNQVTLLKADILGFNSEDEVPYVETSAGSFSAGRIFQSALKPPDFENSLVDISLIQHFVGWEIECSEPLFDPNKAILMDFDIEQLNGVTFMYLLPFSDRTALIEHTLFSAELLDQNQYEEAIKNYLESKYGLQPGSYSIRRKEFGAIPMEDRVISSTYSANVINLGTVGGLTKPTTGYTFKRIHNRCKSIVKALEQGKSPEATRESSYRFRVYDMMLLNILETDKSVSVKIFHDLFKKNRFDRILDFLDEKTHLLQELSIFSSLPYLPFFRSIYKMKHRIVTGA